MKSDDEYRDEISAIFWRLREPFFPNDIEWRVGREVKGGKSVMLLAYLTARAVMTRLDEAVGPGYWHSHLDWLQCQAFACTLSVVLPDGRSVSRTDVCDVSDIEPIKGAASGALKRAAVHFGIGRYLYDLGNTFADLQATKRGLKNPGYHKGQYYETPTMPHDMLPKGYGQAPDNSTMPDEIPFSEQPSDPLPPSSVKVAEHFPAAIKVEGDPERAELVSAVTLEFKRMGWSFRGGPEQVSKLKAHLTRHFGVDRWDQLVVLDHECLTIGLNTLRKELETHGQNPTG